MDKIVYLQTGSKLVYINLSRVQQDEGDNTGESMDLDVINGDVVCVFPKPTKFNVATLHENEFDKFVTKNANQFSYGEDKINYQGCFLWDFGNLVKGYWFPLGKICFGSIAYDADNLNLLLLGDKEISKAIMAISSPIFDKTGKSAVTRSLSRVKEILNEVAPHLPEAKVLLNMIEKRITCMGDVKDDSKLRKFKFIVIEGLDGAGKSTLVKNLANHIGGTALKCPGNSVRHLADGFSVYKLGVVWRAYYYASSYITAADVITALRKGPVVLDRFRQTTTSFGMSTFLGGLDLSYLPSTGDPIYEWPGDLITPDVELYIVVSEDERNRRLRKRPELVTVTEERLEKDWLFRNGITEVYSRLRDSATFPCEFIDGSGPTEQVQLAALQALSELN